jgi:hypothetical protein
MVLHLAFILLIFLADTNYYYYYYYCYYSFLHIFLLRYIYFASLYVSFMCESVVVFYLGIKLLIQRVSMNNNNSNNGLN